MKPKRRAALFVALIFSMLLAPSFTSAAKGPKWLGDALIDVRADAFEGSGAVVLVDEADYDFNERGVVKSEFRRAIKIFDVKERDRASVSIWYEEGYSEVTHFRAWILDPNGKVYRYDKKDTWDRVSDISELHGTMMIKAFKGTDSIREGSVFAVEYKLRKKTVFSQLVWRLQQSVPVVGSKISVTPPDGWTVEAQQMQGASASASREGRAYVWQAENLEAYKREDWSPPRDAVAAKLGINLIPGDEAESKMLQPFRSWSEVAAYNVVANDAQMEPDASVREKAKMLCDAAANEWEKLSAIAQYTQSVNYVSISTDLSVGGGYKPFSASEVLARHYGDCKDKTALARSLLECIGRKSYAVSVDVGSGSFVDPSWPSLYQFNHCIVAIQVDESVDAPAVVMDDQLGRLLLFDPTSQATPLGSLPPGMAGSKVLIASPATERLLQIPAATPESKQVKRTILLGLVESGDVLGNLQEISIGEAAARDRAGRELRTDTEYREMLTSWVSSGGVSAKLGDFRFEDEFEKNRVVLNADFFVSGFARSMRGRFLVLKPFFMGKLGLPSEKPQERTLPCRLRSQLFEEQIEIIVPDGFVVEEIAKKTVVETDFAKYETDFKEEEGRVFCYRTIRSEAMDIPVERYPEVYAFFEAVSRAEQTPVVFRKE